MPITGWEWVDILDGARKQALECDLVAYKMTVFGLILLTFWAYPACLSKTNDTENP